MVQNESEDVKTIVQLVHMDETGDSYFRMRWPAQHLAAQAAHWRVVNLDVRAEQRYEWAEHADLLVLFFSSDLDLLPIMRKRRLAGKKTLVEYNDNFYDPPAASPAASAWNNPLLRQSYEIMMRESDGILVTGEGLRNLFSEKINPKKEIFILKNHLPGRMQNFEDLWPDLKTGPLRVAWAGSLGHAPDLIALLPTIRKLTSEIPHLKFHVMGNEAFPSYVQLPVDKFEFTPWGSVYQYFEFWKPIHIGVASLIDTPYNRCRSDIKAVEMSGYGALPLLPKVLIYEDYLSQTSMKPFRSWKELCDQIHVYARDHDRLKNDARRCFEYVQAQRIGTDHTERLQLFQEMMKQTPPSTYSWPMGPGYHEIKDPVDQQLPSAKVLSRVQSLFNSGDREAAVGLIQECREKNPMHPDLALAEIKAMRLKGDRNLADRLEQHRNSFPDDLRFFIFRIQIESTVPSRIELWKSLLKKLELSAESTRDFFENEVVHALQSDLALGASFLNTAENFLRMFPNSAAFRYYLAMAFESVGQFKKAKQHFDALISLHRHSLVNQSFCSQIESKVLKSWQSALEERIRQADL